MSKPLRGEIWQVVFEGSGKDNAIPCLILSDDQFNKSNAGLIIVLPVREEDKNIRSHIPSQNVFICCEEILTVSSQRCVRKISEVSEKVLNEVGETVKMLLGF